MRHPSYTPPQVRLEARAKGVFSWQVVKISETWGLMTRGPAQSTYYDGLGDVAETPLQYFCGDAATLHNTSPPSQVILRIYIMQMPKTIYLP